MKLSKKNCNCILMSLLPIIIFVFMLINVYPLNPNNTIIEGLTTKEKIINLKRDAIYKGGKIKEKFESFANNVKNAPSTIASSGVNILKNYTLLGIVI